MSKEENRLGGVNSRLDPGKEKVLNLNTRQQKLSKIKQMIGKKTKN